MGSVVGQGGLVRRLVRVGLVRLVVLIIVSACHEELVLMLESAEWLGGVEDFLDERRG